MINFNHIDCTLRDGGYYNNWFFSKKLVHKYISTMSKIGINNIEIGFWSPKKKIDFGSYGNIPDKLLVDKIFDKSLRYGVMINCSDLKNEIIKNVIDKIEKITYIKFIRIACHKDELAFAIKIIHELKKLNLQCMINLMQISDYKNYEIKSAVNALNKSKVDVLYIADSFGSMNQADILNTLKKIKKFRGEIGIHAHDNLGIAFKNTMTAINNGCQWIDTTVAGMGRGAGNAQTEKIIKTFKIKHYKEIQNLINKSFSKLQKKYKWGKNKYYDFAGKNSIHPTYVQTMLGNKNYQKKNIIPILTQISNLSSKKFDPYNINEFNNFYNTLVKKNIDISKLINNKNVLICAPGYLLHKRKKKVLDFINNNKKNITIINLNIETILPDSLVDYFAICHPQKIYTSRNVTGKKIILPYSMLEKKIKSKFLKSKIIDYGLKIREGKFEPRKNYLISPNYLVLSYVFGICAINNIQNIFIFGLDGYDKSSLQFGETQKIINIFKKKYTNIKITFLNNTSYSL